jgi:hypothetical protein
MGIRVPEWGSVRRMRHTGLSRGSTQVGRERLLHQVKSDTDALRSSVPKITRAAKVKGQGSRTYTSKFRGVHQTFPTRRWEAQFRKNGKPTSLGGRLPGQRASWLASCQAGSGRRRRGARSPAARAPVLGAPGCLPHTSCSKLQQRARAQHAPGMHPQISIAPPSPTSPPPSAQAASTTRTRRRARTTR